PDTSAEQFGGAFGVYPYAPSGRVYVSDMKYGLFVFDIDTTGLDITEAETSLLQNLTVAPNPVRGHTKIFLRHTDAGTYNLQIVDGGGKLVRDFGQKNYQPGETILEWDGQNDQGAELRPGVYFLRAAGPSLEKSVPILKIPE
ncbi:MAG: FlgD immunoglobulin-like domain containing protein, partial [Bacteroidota bacterium]